MITLFFAFAFVLVTGLLCLAHFLLTLPMRRAERARMFFDLIETAVQSGRPIEEAIISVSQSRDESMGLRFHLLAAWLEKNLRLEEALATVPRFLSPQAAAMLKAGLKMGDVRKVLPACRRLLPDAVSETRSAVSYLVILIFVVTPMTVIIFQLLGIFVIPKFLEVGETLGGIQIHDVTALIFGHKTAVVAMEYIMLLLLWCVAFVYIGGPRVVSWFPILERVHYGLPWQRKRMQRDFSAMLAILLDSGVPEPEALTLAAACSANKIFKRRARRALENLQQGMKLTQAVQAMDDSGEFGWRLTNAFHARTGFLQALTGWHESLDAKAFQQEQAAAHGVTSALVLWTGLFVGAVVIAVFGLLVSIINQAVLW